MCLLSFLNGDSRPLMSEVFEVDQGMTRCAVVVYVFNTDWPQREGDSVLGEV